MSDGFIYWYRADWEPADAEALVQSLEAGGLSLHNPATGLITALANDPESWGEQVVVSREALTHAAGLSSTNEVSFQFWLDKDTDVYARFRRLHGATAVIEFGLDGLLADEQEYVVHCIATQIHNDLERSLAFVIDRLGATEEVDWDAVVTLGAAKLDGWPDTLALRSEAVARIPELVGAERREEPPLLVFGRPAFSA